MQNFSSFRDFWPHYVNEHSKRTTRLLHFVGTFLSLVFLCLALVENVVYLIFLPIAGYGFAWISHLFVEHNRPVTFTYPLWSLMADFKMFYLMLRGEMDKEIKKVLNMKER